MRVFVTGATGYIGSAIVRALVGGRHEVSGLVRSASREHALLALGGKPVRGDCRDLSSFLEAALGHDAFVHAAFDPSREGIAKLGESVLAVVEAAKRAGKPTVVVYTSGVWVLGATPSAADESAPTDHPAAIVAWRPAQERAVLAAGDARVATAVVRPGIVYGRKGGFISHWFTAAQQDGIVTHVGDGHNRWSFVHVDDLAALYRLVVERRAPGVFHGVDGRPLALGAAAKAASEAAGRGATRALAVEAARSSMGLTADAMTLDENVVAARSGELGWEPSHASFLDGVRAAYREYTS